LAGIQRFGSSQLDMLVSAGTLSPPRNTHSLCDSVLYRLEVYEQ